MSGWKLKFFLVFFWPQKNGILMKECGGAEGRVALELQIHKLQVKRVH